MFYFSLKVMYFRVDLFMLYKIKTEMLYLAFMMAATREGVAILFLRRLQDGLHGQWYLHHSSLRHKRPHDGLHWVSTL